MSRRIIGERHAGNRIRMILGGDALLLLTLFGAYSLNPVYEALKAANLQDALSLVVFLLLGGSTLVAIILWFKRVARKLKRESGGEGDPDAVSSVALDGALLLVWSLALAALCLYAFMLGMAA